VRARLSRAPAVNAARGSKPLRTPTVCLGGFALMGHDSESGEVLSHEGERRFCRNSATMTFRA
jgi:hypothetical protein